MSKISDFLSNENAQLLWEVIIDNDSIIKNANTQGIFAKILPNFYEKEHAKHASLLEMNKNFVSLIVNILKQKQTQSQQQEKPKITFEELQQERVSQFEQELSLRQKEFTSAMSLTIPPVPTFSDNKKEEPPLSEMNEIIKRTIAERNLEIEKIQRNVSAKGDAENWIKGTSTSVKDENESKKQAALASVSKPDLSAVKFSVPNPKMINIGNEEKHISWADESLDDSSSIVEESSSNSKSKPIHSALFSKLKSKDPLEELKDLINKRFDQLETLLLHR